MIKRYVANVHIHGRGDAVTVIDAYSVDLARKLIEQAAVKNDASIDVYSIVPWAEYVIEDMGLTFLPQR